MLTLGSQWYGVRFFFQCLKLRHSINLFLQFYFKDERRESEQNRQLLRMIQKNATVLYLPFKKALNDSQQIDCLDKLEEKENDILKEMEAERKKPSTSNSDVSNNEQDPMLETQV